MSGLDIHYDLGPGHPLLGRRMPDLDLVSPDGTTRVFTLLHGARPVLLDLGEPGALDIAPWADRVQRVDARYAGAWELPVLGAVPAPTAVLIRPDGYVAWVGDGTDGGLRHALTTWFGPAQAWLSRTTAAGERGMQRIECPADDGFVVRRWTTCAGGWHPGHLTDLVCLRTSGSPGSSLHGVTTLRAGRLYLFRDPLGLWAEP